MNGTSWPRTHERIDPSGEYEGQKLESVRIGGDVGAVRIVGSESKEKGKGISFEVRVSHKDKLEMVAMHGRGHLRFVKEMQAELLLVEAEHLRKEGGT